LSSRPASTSAQGVHARRLDGGAGEVGDEAIASRVEDPAPMRVDQPIGDDEVGGEAEKAGGPVAWTSIATMPITPLFIIRRWFNPPIVAGMVIGVLRTN